MHTIKRLNPTSILSLSTRGSKPPAAKCVYVMPKSVISSDALHAFTPATQRWFAAAFTAPTPVQQAAWKAIATGKHCLVIAPTGSGKTLAAFMKAIDLLFQERAGQDKRVRETTTRILYISPVKALAADVRRNLSLPLEGVYAQRRALGDPETLLNVGMRSGDTPAGDRAKLLRRPPDILITTPESLFLMLTSQARNTLRGVTTVIIDEVHAVAGSKRGSQLALSLERLDQLLPSPAQRIGLSATVKPEDRVAHFLGGAQETLIVNPASERTLEMKIVVPVEDMTDIAGRSEQPSETTSTSRSIWPHIETQILEQVMSHRSTLIFANSRGLAEKLTARLNERYASQLNSPPPLQAPQHYDSFAGGTEKRADGATALIARSHHGSVSKEQRSEIEAALKAGELRCVVATSSLELGIDMGPVDLVIQVGAPFSVASALQRVGRAGHQVGGISSGIIFPRTRRDVVDAAVTVKAMLEGQLDPIEPPNNPLDILAQQTLAAVAMDSLHIDAWFALVRRADPFRTLPRNVFDATLDMLAGKYPSDEFAQFRPRLVWDRESGILSPRPGAQHLAVTSGGTIPDRGMFSVVLPEGEEQSGSRRVGELDEEMVYESRVNDIITLGATSWRIQQITHDQVVVVPAPGRSARLPFWHGEGLRRSAVLGERIGTFLRQMENALLHHPAEAEKALSAVGLNENAVRNTLSLLAEQRESTGVLPTDQTLIIERCRDESGDWRVILHSPWGQRVHAPWALAIAERIRRQMGIDPSVVASDDGIIACFPDSEGRVPGVELFVFEPDLLQRIVTTSVGSSALFAARFRECASRALLLPRRNPGKRSPLWQQRLRAGQLLQVAREHDDFPILIETARECLQDVYDLAALHQLMEKVQRGKIRFVDVTTDTPSPFAAPLLFGYVAEFMYAGDAPLAERRASLLSLDSNLLGELLGKADMRELLASSVIERVEQELQRTAKAYKVSGKEGIADLLRELGPLSLAEIEARFASEDIDEAAASLKSLEEAQRVINVIIADRSRWAAIEDAARLRDAIGTALPAGIPVAFLQPLGKPLRDLINRYARTHALFTTREIAERFGLGVAVVGEELERLSEQAKVRKGDFGLQRDDSQQWVAEEIFKRLRLRSLRSAREATQPVAHSAWVTMLLERHGLINQAAAQFGADHAAFSHGAYEGVNGVARVIEQLAGVALPASLWESQILRARVRDYQPAMLDELLANGEVIWCGHKSLSYNDGLISLHLAEYAAETLPASVQQSELAPLQQSIVHMLSEGGAWFGREILLRMETNEHVGSEQIYAALWELAWMGYITTDTWIPVRALISSPSVSRSRPARALRSRRMHNFSLKSPERRSPPANTIAGRWSLIKRETLQPTTLALALVENMLDRYGVITRGSAISEQIPGGFPALQPVLRGFEDAGRLLRGRFVEGLGGAQFADNLTIERLRELAKTPSNERATAALAAMDPANPFGATLNWPMHASGTRPTRRNGAFVVIAGGELQLYLPQGGKDLLTFATESQPLSLAISALGTALKRDKQLRFTLETVDGEPAGLSPQLAALRAAGFSRVPNGFSWEG